MSLRLYDSRTRSLRPFRPLVAGQVGIYLCGPTVQSGPHAGHVRSAVAFDILRRWLLAGDSAVTFLRNVTDIEDKILHNAGHEGIAWWALAERNGRAFDRAYDAVGVLPPTGAPRASAHIPEMITLIRRLIERGHAYPAGGDVYFDVRSLPSYGELSGQRPDAMMATENVEADRPKRDPLDFALWKGAKPGEPAWQTPWGPGRPGWHLECSAMVTTYLGPAFDIHAAGLDLVFPHNENELAQSVAAGDEFARYWLHNGMLNTSGEKMSKSLGNSLLVADLLQRVRPQVLRYYLGAPHYRSDLDWSEAGLAEAAAAFKRVETFIRHALDRLGGVGEAEVLAAESQGGKPYWDAFTEAMDDDLAVPRALAEVHRAVRDGNAALDADDPSRLAGVLAVTRQMLEVLGLDPVSQWPADVGAELTPVVDALVAVALRARADARDRGDYPAADAVRDALRAAGVVVDDTPAGPRWRLADG